MKKVPYGLRGEKGKKKTLQSREEGKGREREEKGREGRKA